MPPRQWIVPGWDRLRSPVLNRAFEIGSAREMELPERPPEPGELVQVRSRRWLVEEVLSSGRQCPIVRLACADDDAQGQILEVLWDYELDRRILSDEGWS